jgi:hypothetical protein
VEDAPVNYEDDPGDVASAAPRHNQGGEDAPPRAQHDGCADHASQELDCHALA